MREGSRNSEYDPSFGGGMRIRFVLFYVLATSKVGSGRAGGWVNIELKTHGAKFSNTRRMSTRCETHSTVTFFTTRTRTGTRKRIRTRTRTSHQQAHTTPSLRPPPTPHRHPHTTIVRTYLYPIWRQKPVGFSDIVRFRIFGTIIQRQIYV